jgi:hypothetical protein
MHTIIYNAVSGIALSTALIAAWLNDVAAVGIGAAVLICALLARSALPDKSWSFEPTLNFMSLFGARNSIGSLMLGRALFFFIVPGLMASSMIISGSSPMLLNEYLIILAALSAADSESIDGLLARLAAVSGLIVSASLSADLLRFGLCAAAMIALIAAVAAFMTRLVYYRKGASRAAVGRQTLAWMRHLLPIVVLAGALAFGGTIIAAALAQGITEWSELQASAVLAAAAADDSIGLVRQGIALVIFVAAIVLVGWLIVRVFGARLAVPVADQVHLDELEPGLLGEMSYHEFIPDRKWSGARKTIITSYLRARNAITFAGLQATPDQSPAEFSEFASREQVGAAEELQRLTEMFLVARYSDDDLPDDAGSTAIELSRRCR